MILLAGTIRIAPGMRAAALPHLHAIVAASRAEEGCIAYNFSFDLHDDHLVHIFECFRDAAAREAHRNAPHMAAWRAAWDDAGIGDRRMREYAVTGARDI
jgi:quinol monooxygenase YgiN